MGLIVTCTPEQKTVVLFGDPDGDTAIKMTYGGIVRGNAVFLIETPKNGCIEPRIIRDEDDRSAVREGMMNAASLARLKLHEKRQFNNEASLLTRGGSLFLISPSIVAKVLLFQPKDEEKDLPEIVRIQLDCPDTIRVTPQRAENIDAPETPLWDVIGYTEQPALA